MFRQFEHQLMRSCKPSLESEAILTLILLNSHIKIIAEELIIDKPVTSYTLQHSITTIYEQEDRSVEFITDILGHTNVRTTQSYFGSFEDEVSIEASKTLTSFSTTIVSNKFITF